jgi:hypothetical protein
MIMGQDSVVGTATHYGLGGPQIESQCRRDFLHLSRPASCIMGTRSLSQE